MNIPNTQIRLDYDPANDVLSVEWPDVHDYTASEAVYILERVLETARLYGVRYLLADIRKGAVGVPEPRYKNIILQFIRGLAETRVEKFARVVGPETLREELISKVTREARLTVPVRSFYSKKEALGWLTTRGSQLAEA